MSQAAFSPAPRYDTKWLLKRLTELEATLATHHRIERALLESEAKYRILFEQTNDAIYLLGDKHFVAVNPKFAELFGLTTEEACSPDFDFMDLVDPESRELIVQRMEKIARGEKVPPRYEFTALSKDGTKLYVEVSVSYIPHNGHMATLGVVRDISDRKQMEKTLQETLAKLRTAMGGVIQAMALAIERRF